MSIFTSKKPVCIQNMPMNPPIANDYIADSSMASDFMEFSAEDAPQPVSAPTAWRVLVVDDEDDVHQATTFALADLTFFGRSLEFLHAHSAQEAAHTLTTEQEIAVILLDVVMETENSGLNLVRVIREDLGLANVRIILRTGQPGHTPEIETIQAYDINDYRTKSELTRTRLYVCISTAIRTYSQILLLNELAFYDHLSHLPNRNKFLELIAQKSRAVDYSDAWVAILDIDDFSEINDALGHHCGDLFLQAVAQRLHAALGERVLLARVGGDAFGLIGLPQDVSPAILLSLFRAPFIVNEQTMMATATIGITQLVDPQTREKNAFKDAHIALKKAKVSRRGGFVHYAADMGSEIRERVLLMQGLRSAIETDRLFVVYQPQVSLDTRAVVGVEALIRWRSDDGIFISPDRFIPLAEASGLIISLGDWVLRTACHELARLHQSSRPGLRMSVNVSQLQFRHPGYVESVQNAIADTGIDPKYLELEITESAAMVELDFLLQRLTAIKALGVTIAIDDFGTGYSSLSNLRLLPVDRLKIDRGFVNELRNEVKGNAIVSMVIALAQNLNLKVIAEGIETGPQAQILQTIGCDEGQGYYFAKGLTSKELLQWLSTHPHPSF